jgi:hypothetical protein
VTWLFVGAAVAHVGSAAALLIILSAALQPALLATPHPAHALALEAGLRHLLVACASTPRLTALPMAALAWVRAGPSGRRAPEFRRWFSAGFVPLGAESAVRATVALAASRAMMPAMTPTQWVACLWPPLHVVSAALTLLVAGTCWAYALGAAYASRRGSAAGPDIWDRRAAAATIWWTALLSVGAARMVAPLAVAFVLRLG